MDSRTIPSVWVVTLIVLASSTAPAHARAGPRNSPVDQSAYAQVRFVAGTGGSDVDGDGSAQRPWGSIRHALSSIADASAERRCAILVAEGTYAGATVEMKPHVDLFGGHDPATWQRDIFTHRTIIDGEHARRPVLAADDARIDGFVITRGQSDGPGGGILCRRASPIISNNFIVENLAVEPADYLYGLSHQVGNDGGGIACIDAAHPTIAGNLIARNKTNIGNGGGIGARNASMPTIRDNVILDNRTGLKDNDPDVKKRARSSNGAGISISHAGSLKSRILIAGNVIAGNRVGGNSDAGGIYLEYDSSPIISGNYILANASEDDGGGIYVMKSSDPLIRDNYFAGNEHGGSIRISKEGRARIHNNVFFANPAGGITCVDSWILLTNNTFVDSGSFGLSNRRYPSIKPPVLANNIFFSGGRAVSIGFEAPEPPVTSNCLAAGDSPGTGNLAVDPKFVDDGLSGQVASIEYLPERAQSRLMLSGTVPGGEKLIGRVMRVGETWTVIAAVSGNELMVWGDARGKASGPFTIAPTFQLSADSPCRGRGAAVAKELWFTEPQLPEPPAGEYANIGATLILPSSKE